MEKYNPWWMNQTDFTYKKWESREINWIPEILNQIILEPFSLHFLTGPRQAGKTTTLKIFIKRLLDEGYNPYSIFYYQCDEILDFKELGKILDNYHDFRTAHKIKKAIIILDEIPYVKDWWRAIKKRIDNGQFEDDVLIITGSATIDLLKEKERFPGRRGNGEDYILFPLDFQEYFRVWCGIKQISVDLSIIDEGKVFPYDLENLIEISPKDIVQPLSIFQQTIDNAFNDYLKTGGFPIPIIDYFLKGEITQQTKRVYLDWIRGDIEKLRLSESYLKEILSYIMKTRTSPVSWNNISQNTSINSPHTIQKYVSVLEQMYVLGVFKQISGSGEIYHKRNKKIHFLDPFLIQTLADYTDTIMLPEHIVEAVIASHFWRKYPTYYYFYKTEVDVVSKINEEVIGFEVKWGPKKWKRPLRLKKCYVLDKEIIPRFLALYDWKRKPQIL